jgi:hypothetical protein
VVIDTGKASTNATVSISSTGANGSRLRRAFARRNPIPIPRKQASRTKLVSGAKYTLLAAVQRISANSTNNIRKLSSTSRDRSPNLLFGDAGSALIWSCASSVVVTVSAGTGRFAGH